MTTTTNNRQQQGGHRWGGATSLSLQLAALVAVLCLASLAIGPAPLSIGDVISGIFGGDDAAGIIVREIRLPRTLLAALIGGTLGLAGASLQGLMRSPLASPYLLGAPSAGAFVVVVAIALGLAGTTSGALPVVSALGALVAVGLLLLLAGPRASLLAVVLAGLAISTLATAGAVLAMSLAPERFTGSEITFWLLGSLENRSLAHLWAALPFMAASWVLLGWDRLALRALALGEEATQSLGIDMRAVRLRIVAGIAAGVGAAVAVAGSIGFVGLVAPQLVRPLVGHDPARLLLPAALAGSAMLLVADIIVRLISSADEIEVGIITALIGAPFFIALVMHHRRTIVGAPN